MKLKIFSFETDIDFDLNNVWTLEIYNQKLFASIVESLYDLENGKEAIEIITLVEKTLELKMDKNIFLLFQLLDYDFNSKKILGRLYQFIEKIYIEEEDIYNNIDISFAKINNNLESIFNELPFDLNFKMNVSIQEYFKAISLRIASEEATTLYEKMYLLMNLTKQILEIPVLIVVNFKCYFSEDQLKEIIKYANYLKLNLLFIESNSKDSLIQGEYKYIIDNEYCEYIIK